MFFQKHDYLKTACLFSLFFFFYFPFNLYASGHSALNFTTIRLGTADIGVLIIGGIQGDEPGGFSAASLLATRYEILKGAVTVVPNLNFPSIIKRSRGLYGDMNRKFAEIAENDPEIASIRRIQEIIKDKNINLVLNLHDGSGYYRPFYQDKLHNPDRWGQSIIIDQENLESSIYLGSLAMEAEKTAQSVNRFLLKPEDEFHVHNTNTAQGNHEMEKSLSWYAVRQGKAAFGLEVSKEFPVVIRTYYHLLMVENFLKLAGVEFKRDFELSPKGIETALHENLGVSFASNRIFLPLDDVRNSITYLPLPVGSLASAITSKPIMAVLPCEKKNNEVCIYYGNRTITLIKPDWREPDESIDAAAVLIDGKEKLASFGQIVDVENSAYIKKIPGYRVNAIGAEKNRQDESGITLKKKDFRENFSIDRSGLIYRIEIYKEKKFTGMFLLRFNNAARKSKTGILPSSPGPESALGF